jgi:hypothetical protein
MNWRDSSTVAVGLCLLSCVIVLSPLLASGYYSDDIAGSMDMEAIHAHHTGFLHYFLQQNAQAMRWGHLTVMFPVYKWTVSLLSANSAFIYKSIILAIVMADVLLFILLIRLTLRSQNFIYILLALFPCIFQFRGYHDAILAFYAYVPIILLELLLSLVCLTLFLLRRRLFWYWLSLLAYTLCVLSHEMTYLFFLFPVLTIALVESGSERRTWARRFVPALPYLGVGFMVLALSFLVRHSKSLEYAGTDVGMNSMTMMRTFLKQTFAAVPLSYRTTDPLRVFANHTFDAPPILVLCIIISYAILATIVLRKDASLPEESVDRRKIAWSSCFGLLLVILPSIPVALSSKYQQELNWFGWGVGYIPVYISSFGILLLLGDLSAAVTGLIALISRRASTIVISIALAAGCAVSVVTLNANTIVVDNMNYLHKYARDVITEAFNSDRLLEHIDNIQAKNAFIYPSNRYVWEGFGYAPNIGPIFYGNLRGVGVREVIAKRADIETRLGMGSDVIYLKYESVDQKSGSLIVAGIDSVKNWGQTPGTTPRLTSRRVYVYIKRPSYRADFWSSYFKDLQARISFDSMTASGGVLHRAVRYPLGKADVDVTRMRDGRFLIRLASKEPIDLESIIVDVGSVDPNTAPRDLSKDGSAPTRKAAATHNIIDFKESAWPGVIASVQGLYPAEDWGAWSSGGVVRLEWVAPLPEKFTVHLTAHAFGPNVGKEFVARAGDSAVNFTLKAMPEARVMQFSNPKRSRTIEIDVPSPASQKALGLGDDERTLGIGLTELRITPR